MFIIFPNIQWGKKVVLFYCLYNLTFMHSSPFFVNAPPPLPVPSILLPIP